VVVGYQFLDAFLLKSGTASYKSDSVNVVNIIGKEVKSFLGTLLRAQG